MLVAALSHSFIKILPTICHLEFLKETSHHKWKNNDIGHEKVDDWWQVLGPSIEKLQHLVLKGLFLVWWDNGIMWFSTKITVIWSLRNVAQYDILQQDVPWSISLCFSSFWNGDKRNSTFLFVQGDFERKLRIWILNFPAYYICGHKPEITLHI